MLIASAPYKFTYVWGATAVQPQFLTSPIPATSASPAASQQLGFPPATASPSGTPPNINDFNGAFNYFSLWTQWVQAGSPVTWDSTFSANNNGYPQSARLAAALYPGVIWISLVDNNTTDPDTGGANWTQYPAHGSVSNFVAGTYSFTCPVGVTRVWADVTGAGGGCTGSLGASGAGGGRSRGWLSVVPGTAYTYVVGAGGVGSTSNAATSGGTSSITNGTITIQATGGAAGNAGPGVGGVGTGGTINQSGQGGTDLTDNGTFFTGICSNAIGGNSPGGGMGGSMNSGGTNIFPTAPGGGGGANAAVGLGQNGAAGGVVLIW